MITVTRGFGFDMGHRVYEHGGKCRYPHGHRYSLEVEVWAASLDDMGMVVDFGSIKAIIGKWIDDNVDHAFCVWKKDTDLLRALAQVESQLYVVDFNPTAENLAQHFLIKFNELIKDDALTVKSVRVFETPNCSAYARQ